MNSLHLYIAVISNGKREAVFAVYAVDEAQARVRILGKNSGWVIKSLHLKEEPAIFRIYDSAWYEWAEDIGIERRPDDDTLNQ